jgi:SAM-dependent MidA family methyltransferase
LKIVSETIATEIADRGIIPFSRFMDLALYCPVYGYYEREADSVGKAGDFYTSPSVGPLFGEMLAWQFSKWLEPEAARGSHSGGRRVQMVEAGAHGAALARDILGWLRCHQAEIFGRLDYWILEPSPQRRERQAQALRDFHGQVHWAADWSALRANLPTASGARISHGVGGIIFSNELLDALPVHRLGWDAKRRSWFEWGVGNRDGRFVWEAMPSGEIKWETSHPHLNLPDELKAILPEGFSTEVCPAATDWWRSAAESLQRGKLITFDYGLEAEEFFLPQRRQGTLRSYRGHQVVDDVLANPGSQDITAHVNFSDIQSVGERAGLKTELLETQSRFLIGLASRVLQNPGAFGEWTPQRTRQFQTLTHPEHLGRAFRVLVQSRREAPKI